jgi:hypothetical protein
VDEPDASAAGAGVAQGAARLCREVADAARVLVVAFRFAGQERGDRRVGHGDPAVPFPTLGCLMDRTGRSGPWPVGLLAGPLSVIFFSKKERKLTLFPFSRKKK